MYAQGLGIFVCIMRNHGFIIYILSQLTGAFFLFLCLLFINLVICYNNICLILLCAFIALCESLSVPHI